MASECATNDGETGVDGSGGEERRKERCRDNRTCLWTTLVVGGGLLLTDGILAIVALASPKDVGVSAEDALSKGQRGFLGFMTLVIFIEGIVLATCDWCE